MHNSEKYSGRIEAFDLNMLYYSIHHKKMLCLCATGKRTRSTNKLYRDMLMNLKRSIKS